jgi:hypothetical protein
MHDHSNNSNTFIPDCNGDFLAFMGRAFMLRINSNGLVQASSQRTRFRRSPLRPDAAFEVFRGSEIMMLKGKINILTICTTLILYPILSP